MSSKSSRASLVWTLGGKNSSRNDRNSWHYQKFPWKRTTYLRSFIHNSASSFNSGSLSAAGYPNICYRFLPLCFPLFNLAVFLDDIQLQLLIGVFFQQEIASVEKEGYCIHQVDPWVFSLEIQSFRRWWV